MGAHTNEMCQMAIEGNQRFLSRIGRFFFAPFFLRRLYAIFSRGVLWLPRSFFFIYTYAFWISFFSTGIVHSTSVLSYPCQKLSFVTLFIFSFICLPLCFFFTVFAFSFSSSVPHKRRSQRSRENSNFEPNCMDEEIGTIVISARKSQFRA